MKKTAYATPLARLGVVAALYSISLVAINAAAQTAPAAPAATPEHTFTPKVSLFSEYEYRGISQTSEKPAVQFNLDYAHSSGFYLGTFVSNISWLKDYIDLDGLTVEDIARKLTLAGLEVVGTAKARAYVEKESNDDLSCFQESARVIVRARRGR